MDDNEDFDPFKGKSEEERRELEEFARGYFSIRAEMEKLEEESKVYYAQRGRFIDRLPREVRAVSIDFYPKYRPVFPGVNSDLEDVALLLFDDVTNLCDHYIDGKPGYYRKLYEASFELRTGLDYFKDRTDIPRYKEIMQVVSRNFEQEYVEGFYFECYRKHLHLLLKRLSTEFIPQIYELPGLGLRELDGLLYIAMLDIFDIICNAEPPQSHQSGSIPSI